MHGKGVFHWPDGKLYTGEYANGKKEGSGIMIFPDGRSYKGEWRNGT